MLLLPIDTSYPLFLQFAIPRSATTLCSSSRLTMVEMVSPLFHDVCYVVVDKVVETLKCYSLLPPIIQFHRSTVQIRRMKVAEIWDKSSSNLSYAKVLSIAAGFTDVAHDSFVANAKATYTDEDGDEVNISSDGELKDAFLQAIAMLPVRKPFLINVTAPKAKVTVPTTNNKATGMPQRIQLKKVEPAKKAVTVSMGRSPIIMGCHARNVLRITPKDFENQSFVHARHTCDGCSKSPIIGTRYHATKIPDFDLCAACFKEYEGDDLDFTPEIQGK
jgi:hypothetical protein